MHIFLKILAYIFLPEIHKTSTLNKMLEFNPKALILFPPRLWY